MESVQGKSSGGWVSYRKEMESVQGKSSGRYKKACRDNNTPPQASLKNLNYNRSIT